MQISAEMTEALNLLRCNNLERNSLSGKFRPARMVQRSGHCLDAELGEIAVPVQMPGRLRKDEKTL